MQGDLISWLFAPFEKNIYCNYFLIIEIFFFIIFFVLIFVMFYLGITYNEGLRFYFSYTFMILLYAVSYFQSRLLYSMCVHSI